jgi:hypothetical protein
MIRLILLAQVLVFISCKDNKEHYKINEGIIEYDIAYSSDSGNAIPIQFLPKKMILRFNQDYASYKIEDMMGIFIITYVTNLTKHTHVSTIKLLNNKYKYESSNDEVPVFFRPESIFMIKETDDTATFAGISCFKSIITDIKERRKFEIAYSNDFIIKHPNINTPYRDIEGVLMKFEIDLGKMRLNLTARKVIRTKINNKVFRIDKDYKAITHERMREIIATMLR